MQKIIEKEVREKMKKRKEDLRNIALDDPWGPWGEEIFTLEVLLKIDKEVEEKLKKDKEEKLSKAKLDDPWEDIFTPDVLEMIEEDVKRKLKKDEAEIKEVYKTLKSKGDYRGFLGVSRHASRKEIKRRFKKLSLELHPDRNCHLPEKKKRMLEEKFKFLNEAHEYLLKNM